MSEAPFDIFSDDVVAQSPKKFEKLPKGKYQVTLNKATEGEKNNNTRLTFEFQVVEGEYEGRKIWLDFLMATENEKLEWVIKRDKGHLRQMAESLGFNKDNQPETFDDFLDLPIMVDIGYRNDYMQLNFFQSVSAKEGSSEWTVF